MATASVVKVKVDLTEFNKAFQKFSEAAQKVERLMRQVSADASDPPSVERLYIRLLGRAEKAEALLEFERKCRHDTIA